MSSARNVVILILLAISGALTYAGPRLDLPKPRVLPVASFPKKIGVWTAIDDRPADETTKKALPTAVMSDRDYRNPNGRVVSLLLLTASEMKDIHSPAVCMPGSGWQTRSDELLVIDGQKVTARVMATDDRPFLVWFWYPSVPYPEPKNPLVRKLYRWRLQAPGTYRPDTIADLSTSLLVRVITPDTPGAREDIRAFVDAIRPHLRDLMSGAGNLSQGARH